MRMTKDLPHFNHYSDALHFAQTVKPNRNNGFIPLLPNRSSDQLYRIDHNEQTGEVRLLHHHTPLVTFRPDGSVQVSPYTSMSSVSFLHQTTPWRFRMCQGNVIVSTCVGDHPVLATLRIRDKAITNPKEALGIPVGTGRAFADKHVGRFLRELRQYRRIVSQMAGVPSPHDLPQFRDAFVSYIGREAIDALTFTHIAHEWKSGQPLPNALVGAPESILSGMNAYFRSEIKPCRPDLSVRTDFYAVAYERYTHKYLRDPQGFLDNSMWSKPVELCQRAPT